MKKSSYKELSREERDELAEIKAKRQAIITAWGVKNDEFHRNYTNRHNKG